MESYKLSNPEIRKEVKDALNFLILICRYNSELEGFEQVLFEMETKIQTKGGKKNEGIKRNSPTAD